MSHLLNTAAEFASAVRLCADPGSVRRYLRPNGGAVNVRQLGGHPVYLRAGTTDRTVLRTALRGGAHVSPISDARIVWDLGANIGVTMIAYLMPDAHVFGLELDPGNYRQALKNIGSRPDRCHLKNVAAWVEDGKVSFVQEQGREAGSRISDAGGHEVDAISLDTLCDETGAPDFVKMDVEGAESLLLAGNPQWAREARSIKVEVHGSYSVDECMRDLESLGFEVSEMPQPWWPPDRGRRTAQGIRRASSNARA